MKQYGWAIAALAAVVQGSRRVPYRSLMSLSQLVFRMNPALFEDF